jgi:anti-sigma regulatory factor (Ser/Thr protein kinase)
VSGGTVGVLQRALLPDGLPVLPTVVLAGRYAPATEPLRAGGDWLDVVVRDERVVLVVGDVVEPSLRGIAAMASLRAVLRARLLDGDGLAEAVAAVDRHAAREPGAAAATLCVAELDVRAGQLAYVTAGHPPPLLARAGEASASFLAPSGAGPLGTGSVPAPTVGRPVPSREVGDGDVLLLYTDGLIELGGGRVVHGPVALAGAVDRLTTAPLPPGVELVDEICAAAVDGLTAGRGALDDIAVLAAQVRPPPAPLACAFPADLGASRLARATLRTWLEPLGASGPALSPVHQVVTELVDNVTEHAYRDGPPAWGRPRVVRLRAALDAAGDLLLSVADEGRWRVLDPGVVGRGLGLVLVRQLATTVEVAAGDGGTTVAVRLPLRRPLHLAAVAGRLAPVRPAEPRFDVWFEGHRTPRVVVAGPLDAAAVEEFEAQVLVSLRPGAAELHLELSGATVVASAAVLALHRLAAVARSTGVALVVHAAAGTAAQHVLAVAALPHTSRPVDDDAPEPAHDEGT